MYTLICSQKYTLTPTLMKQGTYNRHIFVNWGRMVARGWVVVVFVFECSDFIDQLFERKKSIIQEQETTLFKGTQHARKRKSCRTRQAHIVKLTCLLYNVVSYALETGDGYKCCCCCLTKGGSGNPNSGWTPRFRILACNVLSKNSSCSTGKCMGQ